MIITTLLTLLAFGCKDKSGTNTDEIKHVKAKVDTVLISKPDSSDVVNKKIKIEEELKEVAPDTTINKLLFLESSASLKQFYSKDKTISTIEKLRESPIAIFSNRNKLQYLLTYHYEGNPKDQFSCFEVGYFENDKKLNQNSSYNVDVEVFETESKLSLGISLEKLIEIKGDGYIAKKDNDKLIVTYRIDNYDKSPFLKRYNMPGYFMEFTLKDNIVVKILFGFDYP